MEFNVTQEGKITLVKLTGNLIGEHDGMPLADAFNEQIEEGNKQFAVDLEDLKHINSSGLGVLITLLTKARRQGGEMVLLNPSSFIKNLMLITKLNTVFKVFDTMDQVEEFYSAPEA